MFRFGFEIPSELLIKRVNKFNQKIANWNNRLLIDLAIVSVNFATDYSHHHQHHHYEQSNVVYICKLHFKKTLQHDKNACNRHTGAIQISFFLV